MGIIVRENLNPFPTHSHWGEGDILNFGIWDLGCFLPGKCTCGRREIFARSNSLNENFENWEALISALLLYCTHVIRCLTKAKKWADDVHVCRSRSKHKVLKEIEAQFPEKRNKKKESMMADKLRGCGGRRIVFRFPCIDLLLLDLVLPDAKREKGKEWRYKILFSKGE